MGRRDSTGSEKSGSEKPRPSQEVIARMVGVSKDTVSKALRNHPRISKETRDRVLRAAEEVGYRPNPLVSALMSQLAQSRSGRGRRGGAGASATLVLLSGITWEGMKKNLHSWRHWEGAERRANELGYGLEFLYVYAEGMTDRRIASILSARGIRGVLLGAFPDGEKQLDLDWGRYALAGWSPTFTAAPVHLSRPDYFENGRHLFGRLYSEGFRRIGYCTAESFFYYSRHADEAALLLEQLRVPKRERVPVFDSGDGREAFRRWRGRWDPDVIIGTNRDAYALLKAEIYRRGKTEVPVVSWNVSEFSNAVAGLDHNQDAVGAATVDLVVDQLHRNEFGPPEHPKKVMVPCDFVWLSQGKRGS